MCGYSDSLHLDYALSFRMLNIFCSVLRQWHAEIKTGWRPKGRGTKNETPQQAMIGIYNGVGLWDWVENGSFCSWQKTHASSDFADFELFQLKNVKIN